MFWCVCVCVCAYVCVPQVRVVVERLAKRCGFEEVAKHIPESDARLLTHIRKEHNRKQRLKHGGSQVRNCLSTHTKAYKSTHTYTCGWCIERGL